MAQRDLTVRILGNADSLEKAFTSSIRSGAKFAGSMAHVSDSVTKVFVGSGSLASRFGGVSSAALNAGQALESLGGSASTAGRAGGFLAGIMSGDLVGAIKAAGTVSKLTDDQIKALADSAPRAGAAFDALTKSLAAVGDSDAAAKLREIRLEAAALAATDFAQRGFNVVFTDRGARAVPFKGSPDDRGGPRGVGLAESLTGIPKTTPTKALTTGLSEKLKQGLLDAQLTAKLADDLREFGKQRDALVKALGQKDLKPGQVTSLKSDLASVFGQIDGINRQIDAAAQALQERNRRLAELAIKARSDAFAAFIGKLELGVDRAGLTRQLSDDLARLVELKQGLDKQIKAGVDVAAAQSRLFTVTGDIATKQGEIKERAKTALQASQFRALGLAGTGAEIIPGVKNLQTRIDAALRHISGGELDVSSKLADRLKLARKLLSLEGSKLTAETRSTINDLLKALGGLDKVDKGGPLTKTTSLNASKVLAGLALPRDQEKLLRARLSSFNSAGLALAGATAPSGRFRGGMPVTTTAGGSPIIVKVDLDGHTVAEVTAPHVLAWQQRNARRNPRQKRGPNSGV